MDFVVKTVAEPRSYLPAIKAELQKVDRTAWKQEVIGHEELFITLHDHLPSEMIYERELLICRL